METYTGDFHSSKGWPKVNVPMLREIRKQHGLRRETVAAEIGVTRGKVQSWEDGHSGVGRGHIVGLCRVLGVTDAQLQGLEPFVKDHRTG